MFGRASRHARREEQNRQRRTEGEANRFAALLLMTPPMPLARRAEGDPAPRRSDDRLAAWTGLGRRRDGQKHAAKDRVPIDFEHVSRSPDENPEARPQFAASWNRLLGREPMDWTRSKSRSLNVRPEPSVPVQRWLPHSISSPRFHHKVTRLKRNQAADRNVFRFRPSSFER